MNTTIWEVLRQARRCLAWRRAVRAAALASVLTLSAGLTAQLLTAILPFEMSAWWVVGAAVTASVVTLVAARALLVPSPLEAALVLDRRCGLQDRLATWLAVEAGRARSALRDYLEEDTRQAVARVTVRDAIALGSEIPRWRILALLLAVAAWEVLWAGTTLPYTPARQTAELIRQEGRALESAARQLAAGALARQLPRVGEAASQTEEVGRALQQERVDRGSALGRLQQLTEHIGQARQESQRQIERWMGTTPPQLDGSTPHGLPSVEAVEGQAKQLRELGVGLEGMAPSTEDLARIQEALRGVQEQSRGNASAQTQRHLQEAQDRLRRQDIAGARRAIQQAEEEVRELQRLLEEEGMLGQAEQQARRSQQRITEAPGSGAGERAAREGSPGDPRGGSGDQRVDRAADAGGEEAAPEGPNRGRLAGSGRVPVGTGEPTDRLPGVRQREQVTGEQAGGQTFAVEVPAGAQRTQIMTPTEVVSPRIVRQADETMQNARVPAGYREIVRRYFLRLAERNSR